LARFLVTDTETGGTDPLVHSILSVGGAVWEDGKIVAEKEVLILESPLIVQPEALAKNGINLVEHAKKALSVAKAIIEFKAFVQIEFGFDGNVPLVGWNLPFDVGFLKRFFRLAEADYDKLFSHRIMDLASVAQLLSLRGLIPPSAKSSDGVFKHFGITFAKGERHTALGDAWATGHLLTKMLDLLPITLG